MDGGQDSGQIEPLFSSTLKNCRFVANRIGVKLHEIKTCIKKIIKKVGGKAACL